MESQEGQDQQETQDVLVLRGQPPIQVRLDRRDQQETQAQLVFLE